MKHAFAHHRIAVPATPADTVRTRLEFLTPTVAPRQPEKVAVRLARPTSSPAAPAPRRPQQAAEPSAAPAPANTALPAQAPAPASAASAGEPSVSPVVNDGWSRPAPSTTPPVDVMRRTNNRFGEAPSRMALRMKSPTSGRQVVRTVAKSIGLWPPGYTDDPCPDLQQDVERFVSNPSAAGRAQFDRNTELMARYCR